MYTLDACASFAITQPPGVYIYDIVSVADGIISISSDDTLRLIDPTSLHLQPLYTVPKVHYEITCLKVLDENNSIVCTAGRDGKVNILDLRQRLKVAEIHTSQATSVLSLATSAAAYAIAAGTELTNGQAEVLIWDTRNLQTPRIQYIESHNDDVTELQYHPTHTSILLSGSTDGLVNLYDTNVTEEEDALHQTINHGSSIHRAGFLDGVDLFALSHDEKFAIYQMITNTESTVEEPPSIQLGDLRERLDCEYVANVLARPGGGGVVGIGNHSQSSFSLVQLRNDHPWTISTESRVILSGGHDEEVVRNFCFLDKNRMILTGGEDGQIKAWNSE